MRNALIAAAILSFLCASAGASSLINYGSDSTDSTGPKRLQYERQVHAQLRQLDKQISDLKRAALEKSGKARAQINRDIQTLNQESASARAKLRELENSKQAEQAWDDMKKGVDTAVENLRVAYQRAAADLKDGSR